MHKTFFRSVTVLVMLYTLCLSTFAQGVAFDTSRMNRSVDACDDFFEFANGNWVTNTAIPPSQSRWVSFNVLAESNRDVLHDILENAAKTKSKKGSNVQLIGDFYASCMDEGAIEAAGVKPLAPYLTRINAMKSSSDVAPTIAWLHKSGVPVLFRMGGGPDAKNSNLVIVNAGQGGLSLPNKDYYTKMDARSVEIRVKFNDYMTNMFKLLGDNPDTAARNAQTVMDLQMRLANASKAPVDLRD